MRTRHRIPSIFNLSMVDVLCCALGCVLLLWLLNMRLARDKAAEVSDASQQLESARDVLGGLVQAGVALAADLDQAKQQTADFRQRFLGSEEQVRSTAALLERTQSERDAARAAAADLQKKLAAAGQRSEDLQQKLAAAEKQAEGLASRLASAETRLKELGAMANLVPGLRDDLKIHRDKLAAEQALAQSLEKNVKQRMQELADLRRELDDLRAVRRLLDLGIASRDKDLARSTRDMQALESEKKSLLNEVSRARAAAENRFAGISLTGRRVVFLVDKSGSMGLVDGSAEAPDKWPAVRETVVKILRSLPDLERFQVIIFAEDASYLLGQDGRWIDYDPKASPERVLQALAGVTPKGGTNLYAPFEAAFRLRLSGLDTIYLISDGLPDRGVGLPAGGQNLPGGERAAILSKHIRQTLRSDWNRPISGQGRVRINCVGFFYESPDVGAFLWALARENDGSFVGMSQP